MEDSNSITSRDINS